MRNTSRKQGGLVALLGACLLLAAAIAAPLALAGEEATACETVSRAFAQKKLALDHSALIRDHSNLEGTENLEPSELPRAVHSVCGVGLWSGAKPTTRAALAAAARNGRAALLGVDVWSPNTESPDVGKWEETEFSELTASFLEGRFKFLQVPGKGKPLNPEGDGYIGAGLLVKGTGIAKGLMAAAGCWWSVPSHRAVCVVVEEAEGKPVVDHLNALAKKIVPNFLGAP
jgi:hypothetical protein